MDIGLLKKLALGPVPGIVLALREHRNKLRGPRYQGILSDEIGLLHIPGDFPLEWGFKLIAPPIDVQFLDSLDERFIEPDDVLMVVD